MGFISIKHVIGMLAWIVATLVYMSYITNTDNRDGIGRGNLPSIKRYFWKAVIFLFIFLILTPLSLALTGKILILIGSTLTWLGDVLIIPFDIRHTKFYQSDPQ